MAPPPGRERHVLRRREPFRPEAGRVRPTQVGGRADLTGSMRSHTASVGPAATTTTPTRSQRRPGARPDVWPVDGRRSVPPGPDHAVSGPSVDTATIWPPGQPYRDSPKTHCGPPTSASIGRAARRGPRPAGPRAPSGRRLHQPGAVAPPEAPAGAQSGSATETGARARGSPAGWSRPRRDRRLARPGWRGPRRGRGRSRRPELGGVPRHVGVVPLQPARGRPSGDTRGAATKSGPRAAPTTTGSAPVAPSDGDDLVGDRVVGALVPLPHADDPPTVGGDDAVGVARTAPSGAGA